MSTLLLPLRARISSFTPPLVRDIAHWFSSDARHYQVLFQLTFLLFGMFALGWEISLLRLNVIILTCLAVQALFIQFTSKDWTGLKSALISSMSICLMMQANSIWTFVLAGVLAISSKFLIRVQGRHVFNPANFGILAALLITGDAWVSPGQWGSSGLLLMLVGCLGLVVLLKVKRLDTAFAFLLVFLGLNYVRNVLYLGWPHDFFFHQLNTGSLLLFSFFMITDPMATPLSRKARMIWAALVAVLAWWLSTKAFIHTAPLWALICLSPLVPLFNRFMPGQNFKWQR
ncbi:MAG: RnfABCDGE type electron transport complex subunit D [Bacteroidia bacterium]|jgi:Na+-transporting NADH:ubiquinone oxidoreductase subunit NqrB|nr:RnfABCDGE type electron transport complex subunit D [Bacteroidia bacterium]